MVQPPAKTTHRDTTLDQPIKYLKTMDSGLITFRECTNDGTKIYIYYSDILHYWCAYGYSAYIIDKCEIPKNENVIRKFSEELQMPTIIMDSSIVQAFKEKYPTERLILGLSVALPSAFDMSDYSEWTTQLRK